jgi:hypothetical protein
MRIETAALAMASLLGTLAASPLVAQDATSPDSMTCADYMAMDPDGQMQAMEAMEMASSEGMMAEGADSMEAEEPIADGDGMMEEHMAAMGAACDGNPDMMAMDAMMSAMDH